VWSIVKRIWGSLRRALKSRAGVLMMALVALLLLVGGVAVPFWMSTLPAIASCTYSGSGSICDYHSSPLDQRWVGLLLAAAGVGTLVVAWWFDRRPGQRPRQGWKAFRSWGAPLLWLAIIPVIAGPVTYLIAGSSVNEHSCNTWSNSLLPGVGGADCPALVFVPSVVVPGLLNLIPLWWLRAKDPRTLIGASVGSLLGIAGLAGSLIALHSLGPTISWDFGFLLPNLPPTQQADLAFGTVVWLSSIIALLVIAKLPVAARRSS
jgi:hypothetical protein